MTGSRAMSGSAERRFRKRRHRGDRVEHPLVHVDVEDVRAPLDLLARDGERPLVVARRDELRELRRAGDVRPLADDDEVRVGADRERLEAGEAGRAARRPGPRAAAGPSRPPRSRRMCAGVVPQQPPTTLTQPASAKPRRSVAIDSGRLVEAAEGVREAGVRVGRDEDGRDRARAPRRRGASPWRRGRS